MYFVLNCYGFYGVILDKFLVDETFLSGLTSPTPYSASMLRKFNLDNEWEVGGGTPQAFTPGYIFSYGVIGGVGRGGSSESLGRGGSFVLCLQFLVSC